jgi:hypothetical protein
LKSYSSYLNQYWVIIMPEKRQYEAVANLVLRSISVWEDMHLYAMSYSIEYNTFWRLLDDQLKSAVSRYSRRNRLERIVPFTMRLARYYSSLLTPENYGRILDQHWKKQLKIILTDDKFRDMMAELNAAIGSRHQGEHRYPASRAENESVMRPVYN